MIGSAIWIAAGALSPASASATSFSNPASITINDDAPATPYPSNISVSGLGPSVAHVSVTLSGFNHTFPADVDLLLVGPSGQSVLLMSDAPQNDPACGADAVALTLTFDDGAAGQIPASTGLASGTYQPTDNDTLVTNCQPPSQPPDTFPSPAPNGPENSTLSVFNGSNPNGIWSLYVRDDAGGDAGSITKGWTLNISAPSSRPSNAFGFGNVELNKKKGTARLTVNLPGPGRISLSGKGLRAQTKMVGAAGQVILKVIPTGEAKKKLKKRHKLKVAVSVTFTPTGGVSNTRSKNIKLVRKR